MGYPLPELSMNNYERDFVHCPFKRELVSLEDSHLFLVDRIPTDFHSQMLCEHLFQALMLCDGQLALQLRPHAS